MLKAVVMLCFHPEYATTSENSDLFVAAQPDFSIHPMNEFKILIRYLYITAAEK